jgi:hypothetical protein
MQGGIEGKRGRGQRERKNRTSTRKELERIKKKGKGKKGNRKRRKGKGGERTVKITKEGVRRGTKTGGSSSRCRQEFSIGLKCQNQTDI